MIINKGNSIIRFHLYDGILEDAPEIVSLTFSAGLVEVHV